MTKFSGNGDHNPDRDEIDIEREPASAAESQPPQCEISWGDSGLVLTCSSWEDASAAVDRLRKLLTVKINETGEADPPAAEPNDDEDKDD